MLSRALAAFTAVLAGLLAGAMVLIQLVLVPFWRGVPPTEFRRWFGEHSGHIRALMLPLGGGAAAVSVASAVTAVAEGSPSAPASVAAAGATVGVVSITVAVNEPANHRFTSGTITDEETADLLSRWSRWHDVRVALGVVAAVAAATALIQHDA